MKVLMVISIIAVVIFLVFVIIAVTSCIIISSMCSRQEESYIKSTEYCDNNCFKCDSWDWCKLSDRKE
jgi:hypothetical protein